MKKLFTLAAAATMAAGSLSAQAQVAIDGVLNANEMTAGNYVLIGKYTNPRGFGDAGLISLYAASTATKVYFFLGGTAERNGNAFQIFMNLPVAGGVPAGTALPAGATGTSFQKMLAKMELPVDLALALRSDVTGYKIEAASYTNATTVVSKQVTTAAAPLAADGTAMTLPVEATLPMLAGARMAYKNTTDSKVSSNPGNTTPNTSAAYGGAGTYGWEIELDRAAIGSLAGSPVLGVFALQNGGDGGYVSSDYIPQRTGPLPTTSTFNVENGNLQGDPDFALVPGQQSAAITLTATGVALSSKSSNEAASALRFGMYPNPGAAVAVKYTVPQGKQTVELSVFDATGKKVRSLRESQAGAQSYSLNNLRAGIYVVKLSVGGQQTSGKVVVE